MRPFPQSILVILLFAVCSLCAVQWWRESTLREVVVTQRNELAKAIAARDDLESRVKAADAEILRLNGALAELRTNSISKQAHDEVTQANAQLREVVVKQNVAIKDENEAIAKQNTAIQQANDAIKKLVSERDTLVKKVNEVTALYNKVVENKKAD